MPDPIDHTDSKADLKAILEDLRDDSDALIAIILAQAERIDELQAEMQAMRGEMQAEVERLQKRVRELNERTAVCARSGTTRNGRASARPPRFGWRRRSGRRTRRRRPARR